MKFLTDEELEHLTGYKARRCQARALTEMGIRFYRRPRDGRPVVLHDDITGQTTKKRVEPRWQRAS